MNKLVKDTLTWQKSKKGECKELPKERGAGKEDALGQRWRKMRKHVSEGRVTEDLLAKLREVPGFEDRPAEASQSSAEKRVEESFDAWVKDFHAWQEKVGEKRWPTESSKAGPEERRLANRLSVFATRHGLTPEQEAVLNQLPGAVQRDAEDTFDAWVKAFHAWQEKTGEKRWPTESLKASPGRH